MDRIFLIETDESKGSHRAKPPPCEPYEDEPAERERSRSPRGVYDQPAFKMHSL